MKNKILFLIILLAIFGIISKVLALETTWPPSPLDPNFTLTDQSTLTDLVRYFYEWGISIGGLAVLISLLIGGFLYLTSVGNPTRMAEAKDRIFSAVIGLVLLFSIYLILNTINPELTVLTTPTVSSPSSALSTACDTKETDCPGPTCDCPDGQVCKNDPAPGDGVKGGTCLLQGFSSTPCEKAILYKDANYTTVNTEITPGSGCNSLTTTMVNSVKIIGGCTLYLYTNDDCPTPPDVILGSSTVLAGSIYGITDFKSAKIE
jgi:hypothetical protein